MSSKPIAAHELRALWQRLPTTPVVVSADEMRKRADDFRRHIKRRNAVEYRACAFVSLVMAWCATWPISTLWRVGAILLVLGSLFVAYTLYRRSQFLVQEATPAMALLDFHRRQLESERDMLRGMWRWYLLPLLPGMVIFAVSMWELLAKVTPRSTLIAGAVCLALLAVLTGMWCVVVQLSGAARLQRILEDLDRYREG